MRVWIGETRPVVMERQNEAADRGRGPSVIGGCEDVGFAEASLPRWRLFVKGTCTRMLSEHTLRELHGAPDRVRSRVVEIPEANQIVLLDTAEADSLAEAYLAHGIAGPGSRSDALVSWNFKHLVNLGRIRRFNAVNLEQGYGLNEMRTPRELLADEEDV